MLQKGQWGTGKGIRADFQDRFGSEISGLKILQDRIGSDPSLKKFDLIKCDRIKFRSCQK